MRLRTEKAGGRTAITTMSAEVKDDNPYRWIRVLICKCADSGRRSRLMALKRMGIVQNYEVRRSLARHPPAHPPCSHPLVPARAFS